MKSIMKKFLYSVIALSAIFAVSCSKEADLAVPGRTKMVRIDISKLPSHSETLCADFGPGLTRSDYNGRTFTWLQHDSILVCVQSEPDENDMVNFGFAKFVAQSDGASVEFVGDIPNGYNVTAPAFYLAAGAIIDYGTDEDDVFDGTYYVQMPSYTVMDGDSEKYYTSESDKPLANMPLLGTVQEDGTLRFSSMTGALKLSLTGLDPAASIIQISNSQNKLTGFFEVAENGTLTMAGARPGTYTIGERTAAYSSYYTAMEITPAADHSAEVYLPLPVGTLPAGTSLTVYDEDFNVLYERSFKKAVTIARNTVTEIASLEAAYDLQSIGTGRIYDDLLWYYFNGEQESSDYVDVAISYDASTNKYFLDNPYGAAATHFSYTPGGEVDGPSSQLVIEVQDGGLVDFADYMTGYFMSAWNDGKGDEVALTHPYYYSSNFPEYYADFGRGNNFVVKYGSDGKTPANIILSPVYSAVVSSNWTGENFIWSNPIQILFPGASPVDINAAITYKGIANETDPNAATANVSVTLGADVASVRLVIAADEEAAEAAFAAGTGVTTLSASGNAVVSLPANAPSGSYTVFGKLTLASGLNQSLNVIARSDAFNYENISEYVSVGTGYFVDVLVWYHMQGQSEDATMNFIDVPVYKHQTEKKYLIVDPYGAAKTAFGYTPAGTVSGPDKNLVLTVDENDRVSYPEFFRTGVYMADWNSGNGDELCITPPYYYSSNYPSYYDYFGYGNNFVAKYDADGMPTDIILSPVYQAYVSNNWYGDSYIWSNFIEILIGEESQPSDLSCSVAMNSVNGSNPAQATASVSVTLGEDVASIDVVVAANEAQAREMIEGGQAANATATGTVTANFPADAPSGEYAVYGLSHAKEGFTAAADLMWTTDVFDYFRDDEDFGYVPEDFAGIYTVNNDYYFNGWQPSLDTTLEIQVSDDEETGDIMITSFCPEIFTIVNRKVATGRWTKKTVYIWSDTRTGLISIPYETAFYTHTRAGSWTITDLDTQSAGIDLRLMPSGDILMKKMPLFMCGNYWWALDAPVTFVKQGAHAPAQTRSALEPEQLTRHAVKMARKDVKQVRWTYGRVTRNANGAKRSDSER